MLMGNLARHKNFFAKVFCKTCFAKSFATSAEGTALSPDNSQLAQTTSSVRAPGGARNDARQLAQIPTMLAPGRCWLSGQALWLAGHLEKESWSQWNFRHVAQGGGTESPARRRRGVAAFATRINMATVAV